MDAMAYAAKMDPLDFGKKNLTDSRLRVCLTKAATSSAGAR